MRRIDLVKEEVNKFIYENAFNIDLYDLQVRLNSIFTFKTSVNLLNKEFNFIQFEVLVENADKTVTSITCEVR